MRERLGSRLIAPLFGLLLLAAPQAMAALPGQGTTIISPAGLGPRYTGYTGAGVGLTEKEPRYGIRAGDFVIQPRFLAELAYNTNFYRASESSVLLASNIIEGTLITRLRPGVGIYNPKFTKIAVALSLDASIMLPIDVNDSAIDVFDQFNVGGSASADVSFFPKGVLTFTIKEKFQRELWRRSSDTTGNANRNNNKLGADISLHPGGKAIDVTAGYRWGLTFYDGLEQLDRSSHDIRLLTSWRFYPLTHVFLESSIKIAEYTSVPDGATDYAGNYRNGTPFRVYLGLSGYITNRVALLARVGYGNALLEEGGGTADNFESFIGMAQVTFRFSGMSALTIGGARDYDLHAFGGYRWYGRAYLSFAQKVGKVVNIHLDGAFDFRQYGTWAPAQLAGSAEIPTISDQERSDMRIQAGLLVDFNVLRWFGISLGYRMDMILADYTLSTNDPPGVRYFDYNQHRVYMSLNLRY